MDEIQANSGAKNRNSLVREYAALVCNGLLDLIYPPRCLLCGAALEEGALCDNCIRGFKPVHGPFCDRCGGIRESGLMVCSECEAGREAAFAWSQALGQYGGTLRHAIHRLKYDGKTALAQPLGVLLARSLDDPPSPLLTSTLGEPLTFDAVVPVPLHPSRLRKRGFNQAERLARVVARERGWTLDAQGVRRVRRTQSQVSMEGRQGRHDNVRDAFVCRPLQRYAGKSVLIVDDVLTTGSTLGEVARVIRDAGASRVCVIALARGS